MKKSFYVDAPPPRRPLKIFAFDPMLGRTASKRISVEIANEQNLRPGPRGSRVEVIDYDGANECYYAPVDLDDPSILMQGGLDPNESDPRFHQQMVYAVAMKVIENFEQALGRRISFRGNQRLRIFPHAFQGANAFYDPDSHAVLFGYFRADETNPGANLPGQNVFTCLSHDIIAHEMTHALVDRLRTYFTEPSNRDVLAFHEGFADIVAIFQHFSFRDILRDLDPGDARRPALADRRWSSWRAQFGYATGTGEALRSAVGQARPERSTRRSSSRTSAARSSSPPSSTAFFATYQRRIKTWSASPPAAPGSCPAGDLHPDLVNRIAAEASATAQAILTMCIRAFEYLPPVDITFGDYLRALVTADFELSPEDENGERACDDRGVPPARHLPRQRRLSGRGVARLGERGRE